MEIYGKVNHYQNSDGIKFNFKKIDKKKTDDAESEVYDYEFGDLAFEIWKKFKDSKVKITIEKVK